MKTMLGVFDTRHDAEHVIEDLRKLDIPDRDITFVASDKSGMTIPTPETGKNIAKGVGSGAVTGGVIGAIAGLVVANGILPGLGTLFVAGPLAAALGFTGAAATTAAAVLTGAAAGGLIGAFGGIGVSQEEAKMYEQRVKKGDIVVGTVIDNAEEPKVRSIFDTHNADEIKIYQA
ncbi:MAG TPA: general stress protein [Patescibacteria group bacterium]|nr:general stress protein [Patescibacteria group bacterium]